MPVEAVYATVRQPTTPLRSEPPVTATSCRTDGTHTTSTPSSQPPPSNRATHLLFVFPTVYAAVSMSECAEPVRSSLPVRNTLWPRRSTVTSLIAPRHAGSNRLSRTR